MRRSLALSAWLFPVAVAWFAQAPAPSPSGSLVGISVPSQVAQVASELPGKIVDLPFAEGDRVVAGDVLFGLNSTLEQLEVERLRVLAESDVGERRAESALRHAERQAERVRDLRERNIASERDQQDQDHEVDQARLRLEQARLERIQARNGLAQAQERLAQRKVQSPFAGVVTDLLKSKGEAVEKFMPVVEVMSLDPLWVEFDCPVTEQHRFRIGGEVVVAPAVRPQETRVARVLLVSARAAAASHTFMIRAAVANEDLSWKAGLKMVVVGPAANPSPGGK
ncbi:MAG: efflux RND transporter periplasmic adaptor subunit [Planctomycetes bacterium]|nr:efflux RND transporter periplasmic adaptor subunit [Planctomycetota bacterium]